VRYLVGRYGRIISKCTEDCISLDIEKESNEPYGTAKDEGRGFMIMFRVCFEIAVLHGLQESINGAKGEG